MDSVVGTSRVVEQADTPSYTQFAIAVAFVASLLGTVYAFATKPESAPKPPPPPAKESIHVGDLRR